MHFWGRDNFFKVCRECVRLNTLNFAEKALNMQPLKNAFPLTHHPARITDYYGRPTLCVGKDVSSPFCSPEILTPKPATHNQRRHNSPPSRCYNHLYLYYIYIINVRSGNFKKCLCFSSSGRLFHIIRIIAYVMLLNEKNPMIF